MAGLTPVFAMGVIAAAAAGAGTDSPFGVNTHARPTTIEVPHIRRLGAKWVRVHFAMWHDVEREKGKYRFTPAFDNYVRTYRDAGLHLLDILCYGNPLYCDRSANPQHPTNVAPRSEAALAAWGNYVEAVVRHYSKLGVKHWEVWNEPTFDTFMGRGEKVKTYARMLKIAYARAKKADPEAFVVGCSTGHVNLAFIEGVLKAGGGRFMDAVSVHPYNSQPESYGMTERLNAVVRLLRKYGLDAPIWVTEFGVATSQRSEAAAADLLVRNVALMLSCPKVERFFWYDFRNDGTNPDYTEHNFGLIKHAITGGICTPKRGFYAYRFAANHLEDKRFEKVIPVGAANYARLFRNSRENVLIVWSTMSGMIALRDLPLTAVAQDVYGGFVPLERKGDLAFVRCSRSPVYLTFAGDATRVAAPRDRGFVAVSPAEVAVAGPGEAFAKTVIIEIVNPFSDSLSFNLLASVPFGYACEFERKTRTLRPGVSVEIPVRILVEHNNADLQGKVSFSLVSPRRGVFTGAGAVTVRYYRRRAVSATPLRVAARLASPGVLELDLTAPATVSAACFDQRGRRLACLFQGREMPKGKRRVRVECPPGTTAIHLTAARSAPVLLDNIKYVFSGLTRTVSPCSGVAADRRGRLYILSPGAEFATLYQVDAALHARWALRIPRDEYFQAMTCGDRNDLFIASWRKGLVLRIADLSAKQPRIAWAKPLLRQPLALAADGRGNLFIASVIDHAVLCVDANGEPVRTFGDGGRIGFPPQKSGAVSKQPASLAVAGGTLYVGAQAARTVTAYDARTGEPLGLVFGNEPGGPNLYGTNGIGPFAADGKVLFIAEYEMNRVSVYDRKGNFLARWGAKQLGGARYSGPWDAAVAADGSLCVSSRAAPGILRVLPRLEVIETDLPVR